MYVTSSLSEIMKNKNQIYQIRHSIEVWYECDKYPHISDYLSRNFLKDEIDLTELCIR